MLYRGSCHCGKVAFEVEVEPGAALSCNCSICSRKGALLWAVPHDRLKLLTDEEAMGRYTFNKHSIAHRFCRTCGMHPYGEDATCGDGRTAYVNIRCLDGVELSSIPVVEFDGRSML